jgi:hypothetical protein
MSRHEVASPHHRDTVARKDHVGLSSLNGVAFVVGLSLFGLGEGLLVQSHGGATPWTDFAQGVARRTHWSLGWSTAAISVGVLLWFPHFVDRTKGNVTVQLLIFGAIFSVMAFCSDGTWGVIAGTAREWLSGSTTRFVTLRTVGACDMMTLGLIILISALTS